MKMKMRNLKLKQSKLLTKSKWYTVKPHIQETTFSHLSLKFFFYLLVESKKFLVFERLLLPDYRSNHILQIPD